MLEPFIVDEWSTERRQYICAGYQRNPIPAIDSMQPTQPNLSYGPRSADPPSPSDCDQSRPENDPDIDECAVPSGEPIPRADPKRKPAENHTRCMEVLVQDERWSSEKDVGYRPATGSRHDCENDHAENQRRRVRSDEHSSRREGCKTDCVPNQYH